MTDRQPLNKKRSPQSIAHAQETVYSFLLKIVQQWPPEDVLTEFRHLFIEHAETASSTILPALYEIVFSNQELEFRHTLKRSCYILINNWELSRSHQAIQALIKLFADSTLDKPTISPTLKRMRVWVKNFISSSDFQELRLFAMRYEERNRHWSDRYVSYLLVPQYIDLNNPIEQREAAKMLSHNLKEKFKFELALYTAHSQPAIETPEPSAPKNPTLLGDEGLRLIKAIVARRGLFSHTNLANIFLKQTQNLSYRDFKKALQKYLIFSVENHEFVEALNHQLAEKLTTLYAAHDDRSIDDALLLRTTNRVIEFLTTEDHHEPSSLFVLLLSRGTPLTLVVVLLKLILICRYARTHLDARIAELIKYYQEFPQEECQWVVSFFEIFNITMTIYAENIEYNLVSMSNGLKHSNGNVDRNLETYRIFSQLKQDAASEPDLAEIETVLEEDEPEIAIDEMISS
ncbi:hypothetical protein H6F67_05415 [Microcoleus sp. FACHB-1515]|uniref:hypothetical protein n=1 Tax=Cyanophyceae TaxID=3028117 RepID=UPI00168A14EE|nr:hypothetical protein [Microcoleus sp. FACHB-1515]MBD2089289.1 hypothetical protein [Microcoleus sp. FACHB-1515]